MRSSPALATLAVLLAGCVPAATVARLPDPECELPRGTLVDVRSVDPSIRVDVRYATADNFTGEALPGYERPLALLRPAAARALGRVQARLRQQGLGLRVFDAYRPVRATLAMVAWAERTGNEWVLDEGYVARESGHNRGNTVDLTLVRLADGRALEMGTGFDVFSEASHTANATGEAAAHRATLVEAMALEGWVNYEREWWHFRLPLEAGPLDIPLRCFR
jgi:zinc D-Ala-D-Ala dipeptidase